MSLQNWFLVMINYIFKGTNKKSLKFNLNPFYITLKSSTEVDCCSIIVLASPRCVAITFKIWIKNYILFLLAYKCLETFLITVEPLF